MIFAVKKRKLPNSIFGVEIDIYAKLSLTQNLPYYGCSLLCVVVVESRSSCSTSTETKIGMILPSTWWSREYCLCSVCVCKCNWFYIYIYWKVTKYHRSRSAPAYFGHEFSIMLTIASFFPLKHTHKPGTNLTFNLRVPFSFASFWVPLWLHPHTVILYQIISWIYIIPDLICRYLTSKLDIKSWKKRGLNESDEY